MTKVFNPFNTKDQPSKTTTLHFSGRRIVHCTLSSKVPLTHVSHRKQKQLIQKSFQQKSVTRRKHFRKKNSMKEVFSSTSNENNITNIQEMNDCVKSQIKPSDYYLTKKTSRMPMIITFPSNSPTTLNIKKNEKEKRKRKPTICGFPWYYLCLCVFTSLLLAAALAAGLVALTKTHTTTTTSSTTTATTTTTTTTTTMACAASCVNSTVSTDSRIAFYTFDSVITDAVGMYNLNGSFTPTYVPGWVGSAISFNAVNQQWLSTYNMPLTAKSFSIDFWFYALNVISTADISFMGQCYSALIGQCFFFSIYQEYAYMSFTNNDAVSSVKISINTWYHIAYTFDNSTLQEFIYLNGILTGLSTVSQYLTAPIVPFTVGGAYIYGRGPGNTYFTGYMDHLTISNRDKSSCEIYLDANLYCYFKFDSPSPLFDSGPNFLTATQNGASLVTGRVNQALYFSSISSYITIINEITPLNPVYNTFTISMWINPTTTTGGATIIHTSTQSNGQGICLLMWGLTSTGFLTVNVMNSSNEVISTTTALPIESNTWTHVAQTFSSTNGVRLYINSVLTASTSAPTGQPMGPYVFIGASPNGATSCSTGSIVQGQFYGSVDEFRVFCNELTATDVCRLAYPT